MLGGELEDPGAWLHPPHAVAHVSARQQTQQELVQAELLAGPCGGRGTLGERALGRHASPPPPLHSSSQAPSKPQSPSREHWDEGGGICLGSPWATPLPIGVKPLSSPKLLPHSSHPPALLYLGDLHLSSALLVVRT